MFPFSLFPDVLQSAMAQKAIGMGLEPTVVERTILEKMSRTGSDYSSLEALLQDCFNKTPDSDAAKAEEEGTYISPYGAVQNFFNPPQKQL